MACRGWPMLASCHSSGSLLGVHTLRSHTLHISNHKHPHHRAFATHRQLDPNDPTWPQHSRHEIPTPYEIFRQKKGSTYSKQTFYELVKIYHPDRNIHHADDPHGLPHAVRLERYRLVVAANEILSDPVKRRAYDRWGAGWHDMPHVRTRRNAQDPRRDRDHAEYNEDFAATWNNATWEDWERSYRRRQYGPPQTPRYVSNERFVGLIVLFIFVGASVELSRATRMSAAFKEQVEARHAAAKDDLERRRKALAELPNTPEARVKDFLRARETGVRNSLAPPPESRPALPPPRSPNSGWK